MGIRVKPAIVRWGLLFVFVIASFYAAPALAQQGSLVLEIDSINSDAYPTINLMASVYDERGYTVNGLNSSNFSATEDGQPVAALNVAEVSEAPLDMVLLVDASASTAYGLPPTPRENATKSLKELVAGLAASDRVAVIGFNDHIVGSHDLTVDRSVTSSALETLPASGNSVLNDALVQAASVLQEQSKRPVIVLLADGLDSGLSNSKFDQALDAVIKARAVVYVIAWGGAKSPDLKKMADLTHGQYLPLMYQEGTYPDLASFQGAVQTILGTLPPVRAQYQIDYTSQVPCDGQMHELRMSVTHLTRSAAAVTSFKAPQCMLELTLGDLQSGQEVGGNLLLAPRFNRPEKVQSLDILVDDVQIETIANPPFEYKWNSTTLSPGTHKLTLVAHDVDGNTARQDLALVIKPPVTVVITAPQIGEQISTPTDFSAEVQTLTKLSKVEFLVDEKVIQSMADPPFVVKWNPLQVPAGAHDLAVKAVDVDGFEAQDSVRFSTQVGETSAEGGGFGSLGIVLAAAVAVLILLGSLVLRQRKVRMAAGAAGSNATGGSAAVGMADVPVPAGAVAAQAGQIGLLYEREGLDAGQIWPLPQDAVTRLGRKREENDIQLQGVSASRSHATIKYQPQGYVIYPLRPANPVLVNDQEIYQQVLLQPGDVIQMGESVFEFRY